MDIGGFWKTIQTKILTKGREVPTSGVVPRDHIDRNQDKSLDVTLKMDMDYFHVVVNEMFLSNERDWLNTIEPVVFVMSEFTYGGKPQIAPFLVGPALLKERGVPDQLGKGMIIRNTSVAGPYPYRGKGLTLTTVLAESKSGNILRPLLKIVENSAQALAFSPALAPYVSVANVVMDGFDALFSSGAVVPLVGLRDSFGAAIGRPLQPTFFVLINKPDVPLETLWVKDYKLMQGASLAAAQPYRDADFVLYSVITPDGNRRDDLDQLPFEEQWARVQAEAASPIDDPNFRNAKQLMAALYQQIVLSPDLTEPQSDAVSDEYANRMLAIHERAKKLGAMAGAAADSGNERLDAARRRSLQLVS